MKSNKTYQKGDKVLVKSFAGPNVRVTLKNRYIAAESELKREVEKLRKSGVPYKKGEKPKVWVFDWQIIKKY